TVVNPPAHITSSSGSGQSATVNTDFPAPLVATVTDSSGNPVPGATVTFVGPSSGAGVTFGNGNTAVTDAQGQASVTPTANARAGSENVTATVAGIGASATFALTNTPGTPASVTALSGGGQSAVAKAVFAAPLAVSVADAF